MNIFKIKIIFVLIFFTYNTFSKEQKVYTKADYEIAKNINSIYVSLRKGKLNSRSIDQAEKYINKSKLFHHFQDLLERVSMLRGLKTINQFFHDACPSVSLDPIIDGAFPIVEKELSRYCRRVFLKYKKKYIGQKDWSENDWSFYSSSLSYYLKGERKKDFFTLLNTFKKYKDDHKRSSRFVALTYQDLGIRPDLDVLKNIQSSKDVDALIDKYALLENDSGMLQKEFKRLYRNFNKLFKEKKYKESYQAVNRLMSFYKKNKTFLKKKRAFARLSSAAKKFVYKEKDAKALSIFRKIITLADEKNKDDALFHVLWLKLINKEVKSAIKFIEKEKLLGNFDFHGPRLQYWVSKTILRNGEKGLANHLMKKIIINSPLSFYSVVAKKDLLAMEENSIPSLLRRRNPASIIDIEKRKFSSLFHESFNRLSLWLDLGDGKFIGAEAAHIMAMKKIDVFKDKNFADEFTYNDHQKNMTYKIINLLNNKNHYLHTFKIMYRSIDKGTFPLDRKSLEYLFPFPYLSKIKKASGNIEPLLILSLIRQESAFNHKARSRANARGLMQLLPSTARQYKKRLRGYQLYRPELNIKLGIKFLSYLLKKNNGNLIYTLASYNAGEGRVRQWKRDVFKTKDPLLLIESIPFNETRKYVKLIYRNLHFYKMLQGKNKLTKDSFLFVQR